MKIKQDVSLKKYSNYKIGGKASYFLEALSKEDIIEGIKEWREICKNSPLERQQVFILSAGSNILIDDKGFFGLVIYNNIKFVKKDDSLVTVGSGVLIKDFLDFCIENSLSGFEWAGGIPGAIGGAIRGNAGAFNGEAKDLIENVKSINLDTLEEINRDKLQCKFDYRTSIFKKEKKNELILSASFKLKKIEKEKIKKAITEKINYRKLNHPMDFPSLGSTFKNIPLKNLTLEQKEKYKDYIRNAPIPCLPVAKLLYLCDLRGKKIGDAQISKKHPNFIVNLGNAKSEDVKKLIEFIKNKVKEKFDILLEEEIVYLP